MNNEIIYKEYENIVNNNNVIIDELKIYFKNYKNIVIIGKSETAVYMEDAIGINQGLIFTNGKFLFMNDFESLFGIENLICNIEYVFMPDFPHLNCSVNKNFTYKNVIEYLTKYNFKGKVFIYQIQTTLNKGKLPKNIYFDSINSSSTVAMHIFKNILNIENFECYGIAKGRVFHSDLKNLDFSISKDNKNFEKEFNIYMDRFHNNFNKNICRSERQHWNIPKDINITFN